MWYGDTQLGYADDQRWDVTDNIVNTIPSRMTINQLLEVILGKCLFGWILRDATPFQNNDVVHFQVLNLTIRKKWK